MKLTLTVLLFIGGLYAQQPKLPSPIDVAVQRRQLMHDAWNAALMRDEWNAVLNGTHPKIKLPPGADGAQIRKDMTELCEVYMHGSEYRESLCGLLTPTPEQAATENIPQATPLDIFGPPYNPPGFCSQVGRLKIAFQWQRDANAMQAVLAGGGCSLGCGPCCAYSAALALKVLYWELYVHNMEDLAFINGC